MSDANMENLSAAMDGELSKEELRFLLRRLDHDTSLLQVWTRYHVAGDSLRRQLPAVAGSGFATRVMQLIEDEQAASQATPHRRDWLRLSVGGAIAASVAVAALMVSQPTAPDAAHPAHLASANPGGPQVAQRAVADVQPQRPVSSALSAVPPSLSAYSASGLSQQASATLSDPSDNLLFQRYPLVGQNYSVNGYQALNNQDGSYLLLIDTPQSNKVATQTPVYQGAAGR